MSASGIGIAAASATAPSQGLNLTQQDFLSVLITQLQFQDPLQPMNDEQFLGQLAQFSALEVATQQSSQLDTLLTFSSMNQAVALVGKLIAINQSGGSGSSATATATGTVTAVDFSSGAPRLTVNTGTQTITGVPLADVTLIQQ
jgi:flagellar basal-body rod modification protein FlgD